jgi:uncharacterized membrane protein
MAISDEDRILRVWTPTLLRTILFVAAAVLMFGLIQMATQAPGSYLARYHAVREGHIHSHETFGQTVAGALNGDPHSIMTIGLFILTLVPLGRVAFCFLLFVTEADYIYVIFTAYVLAGLLAGVFLGRIG